MHELVEPVFKQNYSEKISLCVDRVKVFGAKYTVVKLEITITRKCCLKGTDWKLAFGSSVGIIEKILACVQPELQASYTRNTYNNVLWV